MRKLSFFLTLITFCYCSCQKAVPPYAYNEDPDFHKGQSLLYHNNDSSFYYFNKVIVGSKDSLQIAMSYNNMAVIQSGAGDYFGSQESLLASLKFLDKDKPNDINCLASNFNELGLNSLDLKNYDAAAAFFDSAYTVSGQANFKLVILNNKALAYQKKGAYNKAIRIYKQIGPQISKDKAGFARMLTNMATTRWLQDSHYHAAPDLITALHIRKAENDLWGQNSSYAHLADFYALGHPDSAFQYAAEMYAVARLLNSPDDQLEALQKLISTGPSASAKRYFSLYRQLSDSVQTARSAARNQFALIRYGAEKNKADNLRLQKDNAENKLRIFQQNIVLSITLVVLIGGFITALFWYKKRKQRLELEAQDALKAYQLKTSKKVHDVVANGLYRVMSEVENRELVDKEQLLDQIETLYEQSRDISYDTPRIKDQNFSREIEQLILSFSSANTKIVIVGNNTVFWEEVSLPARDELEHVLQEIMVNMSKHSSAGDVLIKFEAREKLRYIYYMDDGVGFTGELVHKNGLTNTGNRIKNIKGRIIFEGKAGEGLRLEISFPVQ